MPDYQLFWGDIHNHNELGYGQGSLARSYDIARSHLDFYAFTPHGQHPDGGAPDGYPVVNRHWDDIRRAAADHNDPDRFTCFWGYEWHSNAWGHVHVVTMEAPPEQPLTATLADLQDHYRTKEALLIPHHTAYEKGVDWGRFDEKLSPLVEIFSEHGCSERDGGLHPMVGHSGGPGRARFTAQHGLALGCHFGFSAGTDNHDGYPGGYGLGLTGVWAEENRREGLFEGLRRRRTYAVTGDRIRVAFHAGDAMMGSILEAGAARDLTFHVTGWDEIAQVEVVRNNVPVYIRTPDYTPASPDEGVYRLRLEWGWGPMKGYQVYDWRGRVDLDGGAITQAVPCFRSDPFDERRRKRITARDEGRCAWRSHTSRGGLLTTRNGTPACGANDALCLEIHGTPDTRLTLHITCETHTSLLATATDWSLSPRLGEQTRTWRLGDLIEGRDGFRMSEIPTWVVAHRAVPQRLFTMAGGYRDTFREPAYYYLRVTQANGQMAWSSPIWFDL